MTRRFNITSPASSEQQVDGRETLCFRAERFEQRRDVVEATASREQPWCRAITATCVDVGAVVQEEPNDVDTLSAARRDVQRRLSLLCTRDVWIGSVVQQPLEPLFDACLAIEVPVAQEKVQRGVSQSPTKFRSAPARSRSSSASS